MIAASRYHFEGVCWRVVAAAATGTGHLTNNEDCQDAFSIAVPIDDWLVAVLSDGAGSALYGAAGARAVAEGTATHIAKIIREQPPAPPCEQISIWRPHVENAIDAVRASLEFALTGRESATS